MVYEICLSLLYEIQPSAEFPVKAVFNINHIVVSTYEQEELFDLHTYDDVQNILISNIGTIISYINNIENIFPEESIFNIEKLIEKKIKYYFTSGYLIFNNKIQNELFQQSMKKINEDMCEEKVGIDQDMKQEWKNKAHELINLNKAMAESVLTIREILTELDSESFLSQENKIMQLNNVIELLSQIKKSPFFKDSTEEETKQDVEEELKWEEKKQKYKLIPEAKISYEIKDEEIFSSGVFMYELAANIVEEEQIVQFKFDKSFLISLIKQIYTCAPLPIKKFMDYFNIELEIIDCYKEANKDGEEMFSVYLYNDIKEKMIFNLKIIIDDLENIPYFNSQSKSVLSEVKFKELSFHTQKFIEQHIEFVFTGGEIAFANNTKITLFQEEIEKLRDNMSEEDIEKKQEETMNRFAYNDNKLLTAIEALKKTQGEAFKKTTFYEKSTEEIIEVFFLKNMKKLEEKMEAEM